MERKSQLENWVRSKHSGQLIKLSGEPYFDHLRWVASMAASATLFGYEIGFCHDLLEKTSTNEKEFFDALITFGYSAIEAEHIVNQVVELTDVFTKIAYPNLKKSVRKKREEERLTSISPASQTVKYADLIYNIEWMMQYETVHAEKYLNRKQLLLNTMTAGDSNLHQKAIQLILKSLLTFGIRDEEHDQHNSGK